MDCMGRFMLCPHFGAVYMASGQNDNEDNYNNIKQHYKKL